MLVVGCCVTATTYNDILIMIFTHLCYKLTETLDAACGCCSGWAIQNVYIHIHTYIRNVT